MSIIGAQSLIMASSIAVTWNPADKNANISLSNGNLTATATAGGNWISVRATSSRSSGKAYFEIHVDAITSGNIIVGVANASASLSNFAGNDANGWGYYGANGFKQHSGGSSYGSTFTSAVVIGVAVDFSTGNIWWALNNTWQASGDPASGTNPAFSSVTGSVFPIASLFSTPDAVTARFASSSFSYTPPSGFSPW